MAVLYPDLQTIINDKVAPEHGELFLLNFLRDNFDDSYEVYFQPFLNGDRPDIILMRKDYGVMIIEVKDWDLKNYYLDSRKKWRLKLNNAVLRSPIDQVLQYKDNLYNLHIESLLENKIKNFKYWRLVNSCVYFHNANQSDIKGLIVHPYSGDIKYQDFLKWNVDLLGRDNITVESLSEVFAKRRLSKPRSTFFSEELYNSFKRYFKPPFHYKTDGVEFNFTEQQNRLIQSQSAVSQKVKGVVGSGKSTILATRAVNSFKRHHNRVLILCYNITLKNYLHDKLSKVREDFPWNVFYINNYHNFISSEINNHGLEYDFPEDFDSKTQDEKSAFFAAFFSNPLLFEICKENINKYDTILIDEIQDYNKGWMDLIKKYFLNENGEYVIFFDEKQNIYSNELLDKDLVTNVEGRPNLLKDSFRSNKKLKDLAILIQERFFRDKYLIDDFNKSNQLEIDFVKPPTLDYLFLPDSKVLDVNHLYETVKTYSEALDEHPNNMTVLGFSISLLREFDSFYRYKTNEKTNVMFETQEVWYKLFLTTFKKYEVVNIGLNLFHGWLPDDDKKNFLAVLLALKGLSVDYPDHVFSSRFKAIISKNKIDGDAFEEWFASNDLADLLNRKKKFSLRELEIRYPEYKKLPSHLKKIRDNKKHNFWYNRGTLKISTIHSFKGWETNTLYLILEDFFGEGSDFKESFEELIYTAVTRSKQNLIVINYGNVMYHDHLKSIFDEINKY